MSDYHNRDDSLLQCQKDSYLREGFSTVLKCEKKSEGNSYIILLQNSVLYPEGGGQPSDLGTVNGVPVLKVLKPARNYTVEELGGTFALETLVEVETAAPFPVQEQVLCKVDWKRRYDFMQQHTAQHLFSAVADKLFHAETVGWSLGSEYVTVDLKSSPILTPEQLQEVENEANSLIRSNRRINHKVYSRDEFNEKLLTLSTEEGKDDHEFSHFRGEVKGAAMSMNELRLVSIDELDLNPCGGTHLSQLSELNVFKIVGAEKDAANDLIKVRFLAGERAISAFHQSIQREILISQLISSKPADFVPTIEKVLKDKKDLTKKFEIYNEELASYYGRSLLSRAQKEFEIQSGGTKPVIIIEHRYGADLKFIIRAGNTVMDENNNPACKILLILSGDENVPVSIPASSSGSSKGGKKDAKKGAESTLTGAQPSFIVQGKVLTEGPFILYGEVDFVNAVKEKVLEVLGGRGGGRPGRLQAYASNLPNLSILQSTIHEIIK